MAQNRLAPEILTDEEMEFEAPDVLSDEDMDAFDENEQSIADYIRANEGSSLKTYTDTSGNKTIGAGHKLLKGESEEDITPEKQESLFKQDVRSEGIEKAKKLFPQFDTYPIEIKQALADGSYRGDHKEGYKTTALINSGEWNKASEEYINREDYRTSKASEGTEKPFTGVYKRLDRNAQALKEYSKKKIEKSDSGPGAFLKSFIPESPLEMGRFMFGGPAAVRFEKERKKKFPPDVKQAGEIGEWLVVAPIATTVSLAVEKAFQHPKVKEITTSPEYTDLSKTGFKAIINATNLPQSLKTNLQSSIDSLSPENISDITKGVSILGGIIGTHKVNTSLKSFIGTKIADKFIANAAAYEPLRPKFGEAGVEEMKNLVKTLGKEVSKGKSWMELLNMWRKIKPMVTPTYQQLALPKPSMAPGFARVPGKIPKELVSKYKLTPKQISDFSKGITEGLPQMLIKELSKIEVTAKAPDPLLSEAKKYKSAEEFVGKQIFYHGTSEGAFRRIREKGLSPQSKEGTGKYIYFSNTEKYASSYAELKKGGYDERILRVIKPEGLSIDERIPAGGDYKTLNNISPENIEVKVGNKWIPIQEYSDIEKNIMPIKQGKVKPLITTQLTDIWNKAQEKPTKAPISKTLTGEINARGGLDPDKLSKDYNIKELRESGLSHIIKKGGGELDDIASQLQSEGIIQVPENMNPGDYLMEQIKVKGDRRLPSVEVTKAEQQALFKSEPVDKEVEFDPDKYELQIDRKRSLATPIDISTDQGKAVVDAYESQKDLWFGKKDVRIFKAGIEKQALQGKIKEAIGEKKYTARVKDYDKAMQLYMDTKRNPSHIQLYADKLTPEQTRILTLSQNLPTSLKGIANQIAENYKTLGIEAFEQEVIRNILDNYAARVWDIGGKKGVESMRKFGTTTRHAKARKFETIIEGWANGFNLKIEGASNNYAILKEEIIKTIEDKRFIKSLQKLRTIEGQPLLTTQQLEGYKQVEHPNFKVWKHAGKADEGKSYGKNFFIDEDGNLFERRSLYAPEYVAKNMNNILGISKLNDIEAIKAITRFNADTKAWILQSSFFHHLAFMRSYWFGTQGKKWSELSPRQGYRQGLEAIAQQEPLIELGVKNGLTLGLKQDWNEELLRERTKLGKMLDKMGVARTIRDKIFELRQGQADFLFGKFGAGLKAKAFLIEYRNMLKKHPDMPEDARAKAVANLINDDFGGLHLQRLGRNPTVQHIFRLLALAPDWTESNVRTMVKAIKGGGKEETGLYRSFWAGIFTKAMGLTVIANALMAGFDEDDKDAQGAWQRFLRNYRVMFRHGKLRYLDVDITPLYRALGGKAGKRKYFTILGHFKDPIKFILHPIKSAHHKGSVVYKFFHEALSGVNWAGKRFTTAPEIAGLDMGKGRYKTTRRGKYSKGDPKWGKLKGKTVTWQPGEKGPVTFKQLPSFILNQIKAWQPIQIQNLMGWLAGEMDGFDAISKSMGLRTATTYGETKEVSKGSRWGKKKSKGGRWK